MDIESEARRVGDAFHRHRHAAKQTLPILPMAPLPQPLRRLDMSLA